MSPLWYKEWREFAGTRQMLALRLILPLLVLGPLMRLESLRMPVLAGALAYLGTYGTGAQVARERISGLLPRLALTPVHPERLIAHRILSRSLLLTLQMAPVVSVALWLGALANQVLTVIPAILAACAGGALIGLRSSSRRAAQLAGLASVAGAAIAGWNVSAPPKGSAPVGLTLMGLAPAQLPLYLAIWLLTVTLCVLAVYASSSIFAAGHE